MALKLFRKKTDIFSLLQAFFKKSDKYYVNILVK